jgi:hypothetical protein
MLTMRIAEDALAAFRLSTNITDGTAIIDGIRLGAFTSLSSYLAVCKDGSDVLLTHLSDQIRVFGSSLNDVVNAVLELSERLKHLETDLNSLIDSGAPLQALVDRSLEHFNNPIFIIDETNTVRARTGHAPGTVNDDWDYIVQFNQMPIDRVRAIYNTNNINWFSPARLKKPFLYGPPGMAVRGINFRIPSADRSQFTGTLIIIENETPVTVGMLQYSSILTDAVTRWAETHQKERVMYTAGDTLSDLLSGVQLRDESLHMLENIITDPGGAYRLACAVSRDSMRISQYLHMVDEKLTHCVCCEHADFLIMLFGDIKKGENLNMLEQLFRDIPVAIGISNAFTDLKQCVSCLRQAQIAVRCGNRKISELNAESVMKYIAAEASAAPSGSDLIHPALRRLKKYDNRHGTPMYETLRVFLKHERSLAASLLDLSIHRNSLIYRLERIRQITGCDLNDADTREWLLFSFRMAENP